MSYNSDDKRRIEVNKKSVISQAVRTLFCLCRLSSMYLLKNCTYQSVERL